MDSQITVTMPNIASFWTGIPIINGKTMTVMRLFTIFVRTRKFGKPAVLNIIIECRVSTSIYRIRTMVDSKIGIIGRLTIINHEYRTSAPSTSLFTSNFVEINVLSNILIRIRFLFIPLDHNIQLFRTTKYTTIIIYIVLFLATE